MIQYENKSKGIGTAPMSEEDYEEMFGDAKEKFKLLIAKQEQKCRTELALLRKFYEESITFNELKWLVSIKELEAKLGEYEQELYAWDQHLKCQCCNINLEEDI